MWGLACLGKQTEPGALLCMSNEQLYQQHMLLQLSKQWLMHFNSNLLRRRGFSDKWKVSKTREQGHMLPALHSYHWQLLPWENFPSLIMVYWLSSTWHRFQDRTGSLLEAAIIAQSIPPSKKKFSWSYFTTVPIETCHCTKSTYNRLYTVLSK